MNINKECKRKKEDSMSFIGMKICNNGIVAFGDSYHTVTDEKMKNHYENWLNSLSYEERQCFKRYRNKLNTLNNQNAQLRKGNVGKSSIVMSSALNRAYTPENILVFRTIDKKENEVLLKLRLGEKYNCPDFKGTHAKNKLRRVWLIGTSAGYMIILIPRGASAAYINNCSRHFKFEKELLINRNQSYLLLEVLSVFGKNAYILKLE